MVADDAAVPQDGAEAQPIDDTVSDASAGSKRTATQAGLDVFKAPENPKRMRTAE